MSLRIYTDGSKCATCFVPVVEPLEPHVDECQAEVNQAEYLAAIRALLWADAGRDRTVVLLTDSELLVNQYYGFNKVKSPALKALLAKLKKLALEFDSVELVWVAREFNEAGKVLEG